MLRENEPLPQKPMHLFVKQAEEYADITKSLVCLITIFTGIRANTLCHLHSSWFKVDEGRLYLRIPSSFPCLKYGTDEPCGDCRQRQGEYAPKTLAGENRRLMIPERWTNHYTDTKHKDKLKLRRMIEHYFAIGDDDFGNEMIAGDGISISTANNYVKQMADAADIGFYLKTGYIDHSHLGRVPDVMMHDLRGSYCVQLMRNDANPYKAIKKTGHAHIDQLEPYIKFAESEFDGIFEEEYI